MNHTTFTLRADYHAEAENGRAGAGHHHVKLNTMIHPGDGRDPYRAGYLLLNIGDATNAHKLAEAINAYVRDPKPSTMHRVSNRLRCLRGADRHAVLAMLDNYRSKVEEGES